VTDNELHVLVICGSLRKGSYNAALARTLPGLAPPAMKLSSAPSHERFPIYNADLQQQSGFPAEVQAWADAIRTADGVIIVSPEYNWSIPGGLKNAIDWVSRMKENPLKDKPVAIQSAAPGLLGGARMQYQLRQALLGADANVLVKPEVIVNLAAQKFEQGTLALKDQTAIDLIRQQLAGFERFIRLNARAA
jgi:chromate reductase